MESITVPEKEREQLRSLFRRRNELVKDFRKVKSRLKAQLLFFGIEIPEGHDNPNWTHSFRNWIRAIKFEYSTADYTLQNQLDHFEYIDKQVRAVSVELRKYCRRF